jgi:hypothetical protein
MKHAFAIVVTLSALPLIFGLCEIRDSGDPDFEHSLQFPCYTFRSGPMYSILNATVVFSDVFPCSPDDVDLAEGENAVFAVPSEGINCYPEKAARSVHQRGYKGLLCMLKTYKAGGYQETIGWGSNGSPVPIYTLDWNAYGEAVENSIIVDFVPDPLIWPTAGVYAVNYTLAAIGAVFSVIKAKMAFVRLRDRIGHWKKSFTIVAVMIVQIIGSVSVILTTIDPGGISHVIHSPLRAIINILVTLTETFSAYLVSLVLHATMVSLYESSESRYQKLGLHLLVICSCSLQLYIIIFVSLGRIGDAGVFALSIVLADVGILILGLYFYLSRRMILQIMTDTMKHNSQMRENADRLTKNLRFSSYCMFSSVVAIFVYGFLLSKGIVHSLYFASIAFTFCSIAGFFQVRAIKDRSSAGDTKVLKTASSGGTPIVVIKPIAT